MGNGACDTVLNNNVLGLQAQVASFNRDVGLVDVGNQPTSDFGPEHARGKWSYVRVPMDEDPPLWP
jgi:hypothetical protein